MSRLGFNILNTTLIQNKQCQLIADADCKANGMTPESMHAYWVERGGLPGWSTCCGDKMYNTPSFTAFRELRNDPRMMIVKNVITPHVSPANKKSRLDFASDHVEVLFKSHPVADDATGRVEWCRIGELFISVDETYIVHSPGIGKYLQVKRTMPNEEDELEVEDDDGLMRPLTEKERSTIADEFKGHPPKILLITWVTSPHLLNPANSHVVGPEFCKKRNGIICVRRIVVEHNKRGGSVALRDIMVNSANYCKLNQDVVDCILAYKSCTPYEKCINTPLDLSLTTEKVNQAKLEADKAAKAALPPKITQAALKKTRKENFDALPSHEQEKLKKIRKDTRDELKEAFKGRKLPLNMDHQLAAYYDGDVPLTEAVAMVEKELARPDKEEQERRRNVLRERFKDRKDLEKHLPVVNQYIKHNEEDFEWAWQTLMHEMDGKVMLLAEQREAFLDLLRTYPEMIAADNKLASGEWDLERYCAFGRVVIFIQQDSAGGHGLAGGTASEEQQMMQQWMLERGVKMFQQPPHSPELNLNDLGFNYSLQCVIRAKGASLGASLRKNEELIQEKIWKEVCKAVEEYDPGKSFNMSMLRVGLLHENVDGEAKSTLESASFGGRIINT